MLMKVLAIFFGLLFIVAGVLGFLPSFTPNGYLFCCFAVNVFHNLVHILTGVIAIGMGFLSPHAARLFFRIFGLVYVLLALVGLYYGKQPIFGLIANNFADVLLHLGIGGVALYIGFGIKEKTNT